MACGLQSFAHQGSRGSIGAWAKVCDREAGLWKQSVPEHVQSALGYSAGSVLRTGRGRIEKGWFEKCVWGEGAAFENKLRGRL